MLKRISQKENQIFSQWNNIKYIILKIIENRREGEGGFVGRLCQDKERGHLFSLSLSLQEISTLSLSITHFRSLQEKKVPSFTRKKTLFAILPSSFSRKWQSKIKRTQSEKSSLRTEESWYFKHTIYLECSVLLHLSALYFKQYTFIQNALFFHLSALFPVPNKGI